MNWHHISWKKTQHKTV